jgi:hypothetical protein
MLDQQPPESCSGLLAWVDWKTLAQFLMMVDPMRAALSEVYLSLKAAGEPIVQRCGTYDELLAQRLQAELVHDDPGNEPVGREDSRISVDMERPGTVDAASWAEDGLAAGADDGSTLDSLASSTQELIS